MTPTEYQCLRALVAGDISGAASMASAIWPDREMTPAGGALAVSRTLLALEGQGYLVARPGADKRSKTTYSISAAGKDALEQNRAEMRDPRQISLF